MTNHLRAIDIKEYAKALDVAKEFADRAEKAEAAIKRVRELHGRLEVAGLSGPSFVCLECYDAEWPCATIRALDGDA